MSIFNTISTLEGFFFHADEDAELGGGVWKDSAADDAADAAVAAGASVRGLGPIEPCRPPPVQGDPGISAPTPE